MNGPGCHLCGAHDEMHFVGCEVATIATLRAQLDAVTRERDRFKEAMAMARASRDSSVPVEAIDALLGPYGPDAARLDLAAATLRAERAERVVEACRPFGGVYDWVHEDVDALTIALAAYDREAGK